MTPGIDKPDGSAITSQMGWVSRQEVRLISAIHLVGDTVRRWRGMLSLRERKGLRRRRRQLHYERHGGNEGDTRDRHTVLWRGLD
ncbi:hypothetical protein GUJ93_ZPchr0002g25684 [Zizania palustris]|uniref:Uncharacterized protein n=1 Tax=Zizania palustris TaxID=103762 RepID=A0A8J5SDD9_ZIZPA|nr:hypothetical protein GUJ93_ZPchr0002g25684 [Zizania palustris]